MKQLKANVKKYRDVLGEHAESIPSVAGEDSTQDQSSGASRTRGSLRRPRPSALQSKHVGPSVSNKRASSLGPVIEGADADAKGSPSTEVTESARACSYYSGKKQLLFVSTL